MAKSYKCTQLAKVTIVLKSPRNGNSKAEKRLTSLSSTTNEMDALDDSYTNHPFVD